METNHNETLQKKGKKSYTILFRLKEKVVITQVLIIRVVEPRKKKTFKGDVQ